MEDKIKTIEMGGHRILDGDGKSHYIPAGWRHLSWRSKTGSGFKF